MNKQEKDIYIKDEGEEFSTVIFQSKAAKTAAKGSNIQELKLDVPNNELYKILAWAVSHALTVDSEVTIVIEGK